MSEVAGAVIAPSAALRSAGFLLSTFVTNVAFASPDSFRATGHCGNLVKADPKATFASDC
jgi:hypothetical protein